MIIKFIHVALAITMLGLSFASSYYLFQTLKLKEKAVSAYTLRLVLTLELCILLPMLLSGFITGPILVHYYQFDFHTAWIVSAFIFLTLIILIRIASTGLIWFNYRKQTGPFRGKWLYLLLQLLFWLIALIIIHDAIVHPTTYLWQ
jgi:uncharacterized membrane protein